MTPGVPSLLQLLHPVECAQPAPSWSSLELQPQAGDQKTNHRTCWGSSRQWFHQGRGGKRAGPAGSWGMRGTSEPLLLPSFPPLSRCPVHSGGLLIPTRAVTPPTSKCGPPGANKEGLVPSPRRVVQSLPPSAPQVPSPPSLSPAQKGLGG